MTTSRWFRTAAVLGSLLAVPLPATGQSYSVVEVPTLAGAATWPHPDVNNALSVVGLFGGSPSECCGVYLSDSTGVQPALNVSDATSVRINNLGAIGGIRGPYLNSRAFVAIGNHYSEVPLDPQWLHTAVKLTDSGILLIRSTFQRPSILFRDMSRTYAVYQSRLYDLGEGLAGDISEEGVVGGSDAEGRPILRWPDGRSYIPWPQGKVEVIGAAGHFAGTGSQPTTLYLGRPDGSLTLVPTAVPIAVAFINRSGDLVGTALPGFGAAMGVLYSRGTFSDLNLLVRQPAPYIRTALRITDSGVILATVEGDRVVLLVPREPPPPTGLRFSVAGSLVTLAWDPVPNALEYLIEAGSGAGLSDVYNASVGANTSVGTTAPPGRYYVRVRARNAVGVSAVSAEVVLNVTGSP